MRFGIDFDGVFAADPATFRKLVALLREAGHECVLVTGREDEGQWGEEVRDLVGDLMPIVLAGHVWKRQAAAAAGYPIDVWIDDHPEYIGPQTDHEAVARKQSPA